MLVNLEFGQRQCPGQQLYVSRFRKVYLFPYSFKSFFCSMQTELTFLPGIDRIRQDTPGCTGDTLFMNSAGASLMPGPVLSAMTKHLQLENELGGYGAERQQAGQIARFYDETALLLNTKPDNIAYAYSATDAFIRAMSSIPFREGDTILTTNNDYISNQLVFLSLQKRLGIQLIRINDLPDGDLDLSHLEDLLRRHSPRLVAITHIPTNSGTVLPAEAIGQLCHQYDVWYLLDAAQSVGQLPLDVTRIRPDFLVATGRKFLRGPRNTGFLYVSDKALQVGLTPLFVERRGASWTAPDQFTIQPTARRFEPQEISLLIMGLAEAIRYANQIGIQQIAAHNQLLMQQLRHGLAPLPGLTLMDRGPVLSNILTFHVANRSLPALEDDLRQAGIVFTAQQAQAALIDFQRKGIDWIIRLSPHYFNTSDEITAVCRIISRCLE